MTTKHLLLFMVLAVACKSQHGIPTPSVVGGTGGGMVTGGTIGDAGGSTLTGGIAASVPAGSTGGSAGGLTGATGSIAAGTTGSTGGGCATVDACVGDAVGEWKVISSCLRSGGRSDIADYGLPCMTAEITGNVFVTGSLLLTADGQYADKTVTTGSETWALDKECLLHWAVRVTCEQIGAVIRSLLLDSYDDFKCADAASGGCTCQGQINQSGGMGIFYNDPHPSGSYTLTGGTLILDDVLTYSLCAENGSRLTLSPKPATGTRPYTGSIVFGKTAD